MVINNNLMYLVSWYDETLEKVYKTGVKGKYVNNLVEELKTVEDYNNIKVEKHWVYNN